MIRSLLIFLLVVVLALMIADRGHRAVPPPAAAAVATPRDSAPRPTARPALVVSTVPPDTTTPVLDMLARLAVRRRLAREGDRVYLDSLFLHTDSMLARWPDHRTVTVAIVDDSSVVGWTAALAAEARSAIHRWDDNAAGITLREVGGADSADIVVQWVPTLPTRGQVGSTMLSWSPSGVAYHATVLLALRRNTDSLALPASVRTRVAVHELGHALGLPHSDNDDDVMFFTSPVDAPSMRDQATLRLLYAVPPGPLRVSP